MGTHISISQKSGFTTFIFPLKIMGGGVAFFATLTLLFKVEFPNKIYFVPKIHILQSNTSFCIFYHVLMLQNNDVCQILT